MNGLRWGGGSKSDGEAVTKDGRIILSAGIPSDWGHVDLGPRRMKP